MKRKKEKIIMTNNCKILYECINEININKKEKN